jgi:hypothetical protein
LPGPFAKSAAQQRVIVRILLRAIERCLRKQSPDCNTRNPSPQLCRGAGARGRSEVINAETMNGWIWPDAEIAKAQVNDSFRS